MTLTVRFHPLATAEVVEAQLYYEDQRVGLGDRFLGALGAATDRVTRWPNTGAPTRVDTDGVPLERRIGTPGFPYVVVYRHHDSQVEVLAVHHEHRRPFYWADRADDT